jgi:hypothetical protein
LKEYSKRLDPAGIYASKSSGWRTAYLSSLAALAVSLYGLGTTIYYVLPDHVDLDIPVLWPHPDDMWGAEINYTDISKNGPKTWVVNNYREGDIALVREFKMHGRGDWIGEVKGGTMISGVREVAGPSYDIPKGKDEADYQVEIAGKEYGLWVESEDTSYVFSRHGRAGLPIIGKASIFFRKIDLREAEDQDVRPPNGEILVSTKSKAK